MAELKDITLFLLDMDGTVNLGYDPIDGAKEFLCTLKEQGKNFIFLTNNSSKSVDKYIEKLKSMGIDSVADDFLTSTDATVLFLKKKTY